MKFTLFKLSGLAFVATSMVSAEKPALRGPVVASDAVVEGSSNSVESNRSDLPFISSTTNSSPQNNIQKNPNRQLSLPDKNIAQFFDPKSVSLRSSSFITNADDDNHVATRRTNCQIIYVLGVEGSIHHGFMPIITSLARQQVDPVTGTPYHVHQDSGNLRKAIFKRKKSGLPLNDPQLVQSTLDQICPYESGKKHVILEGNSFPSGRGRAFSGMTTEEIATSEVALNHPTNLYQLYDAYSPYVDIKFIVLHRPYLDTIASKMDWDEGPEGHSHVISGFLLLLSRFLMGHLYGAAPDAAVAGGGGSAPLWTIVCADKLSSKEYDTQQQAVAAQEHVLSYLANFLGWPQQSCPKCFNGWHESDKTSPEERMGEKTTKILMDKVNALEGIWPPRRREDDLPEQQCRM